MGDLFNTKHIIDEITWNKMEKFFGILALGEVNPKRPVSRVIGDLRRSCDVNMIKDYNISGAR